MSIYIDALALLDQLPPDSVRLPLVVENPEWDKLLRPLQAYICLLAEICSPEQIVKIVSVVLESAYTLGYQRGQRVKPLTFVVGNPEGESNGV